MRRPLRVLAGRGAAVAAAAVALAVASRLGGGAEARREPPRPLTAAASADAGAASPAAQAEALEVALRLVDAVGGARFEVPGADAAERALSAHWRKLRPPFVSASGAGARFLTSVALRTSETETPRPLPDAKGKPWTPEARLWNLNEGSFEQREAIWVPAPSSARFTVHVPAGAVLTFAQGTLEVPRAPVTFVVRVTDQLGAAHEVHRGVLAPSVAPRWQDARCDLSAFAGQTVELELHVEPPPAPAPTPARAEPRPKKNRVTKPAPAPKSAPVVALWGNPTVLARTQPRVPYNVLWIVVDALRPDAIASFHDAEDDAKKRAAPHPPLEALLPEIPGLTPALDALSRRGVRFTSAYSPATWTRPGTVAMLAGARSTELGLDLEKWMLPREMVARFYASEPPLLPLALRRHGAVAHAIVDNVFLTGYAPVGVELGFERVVDHRYATRDTALVTEDAKAFLREHGGSRFFLFVNYDAPHEPWDPPAEMRARVPPPPAGPKDPLTRLYLAEVAKDDAAIGELVAEVERLGLRERTVVVVAADHGETLSSAHDGAVGPERTPVRFHHAAGNYEETTRVPILLVAPGLLPEGGVVRARVRTTDLAPTLNELLGLEPHPRTTGRSLVALARGGQEAGERVVVTEGRGLRAVMHGRYRLLVREGPARTTVRRGKAVTTDVELYDLEADPGERHDIAPERPDLVAEMRARLEAGLVGAPVPGAAHHAEPAPAPQTVRLRWAGGPSPRRVSGFLTVGDEQTKVKATEVRPVQIGRDAFRHQGARIEVAFTTSPTAPMGLDLVVDPPGAPVTWELYLDDAPWPEDHVLGGPYGVARPALRRGLLDLEGRLAAAGRALPPIDPARDVGLFVLRDRGGEPAPPGVPDEAAEEMARLLRAWGYAHGPGAR